MHEGTRSIEVRILEFLYISAVEEHSCHKVSHSIDANEEAIDEVLKGVQHDRLLEGEECLSELGVRFESPHDNYSIRLH